MKRSHLKVLSTKCYENNEFLDGLKNKADIGNLSKPALFLYRDIVRIPNLFCQIFYHKGT